ncbi:DinB family protein [Pseudoxanthomonas sp. 10H]|uniref:DinB family protein n=1 Tax=Pseudoxanthomonas sp. 10H TaxID=3242729 RepID=UPI0035592585
MLDHFALLAGYNRWMNGNLQRAAAALPADALEAPKGAFFGSILGTLDHLVVADTIWLKRFAANDASGRWTALQALDGIPAPTSLDARPCADLAAWWNRRQALDDTFVAWIGQLQASDLEATMAYGNLRGEPMRRRLSHLLLHVFNHQAHHRGQATTLFSQCGVDVGVTDLHPRLPVAP